LFFGLPYLNEYIDLSLIQKPEELVLFGKTIFEEFSQIVKVGSENGIDFYSQFKDSLDGSLAIRVNMWFFVIYKYITYNPFLFSILFGISPGQNGVIIDGLFVRLVFEFGILGCIFFFFFVKKLFSYNKVSFYLLLVMILSGLTLDPFTSSKIMLVLSLLIYKSNHTSNFKETLCI
jgi:hypothetical protein